MPRLKLYAMLSERLQTTLHIKKSYAMLPERLQTTLHKKNVPFNVSGLCNLGPMHCCPEAPSNIVQEKI